jgi:hypothetical protein
MAKKYKIKKSNLTEFFGWFSKKDPPKQIQQLIDDDPELQKLRDKIDSITRQSIPKFEKMKTQFLNECNGYVKSSKDLSVSQDVLPASSDEYLNNIIKTEQFGSNSGKNLGIERATLSANGMNTNGRVINGTLFRGVM